jgi:PTH1 family peptidyl-tRNA hydrolase
MRLLVGLGNPGPEYTHTRHNIGFACVEAVAAKLGGLAWKEFKDGLVAEYGTGVQKVLLFKPMQYMNNSGIQVSQVLNYYDIATDDMAVVLDDVYINPGTARMRQSGGDGGHNGLKSIIAHVDPDTFWRVKIGVGLYEQHPTERHHLPPLEDYVLQRMPKTEEKAAHELIDRLVPDLVTWLEQGKGLEQRTIHL